MDVKYFRIKNWDKYQNFKFKQSYSSQDFIILASTFLDDPKTCHLSTHIRLSWVVLMLLAGRHQNRLRWDPGWCQVGGRLKKAVDLALFESLGLIEKITEGVKEGKEGKEETANAPPPTGVVEELTPMKKKTEPKIDLIDLWNSNCGSLPSIKQLGKIRPKKWDQCLRQNADPEYWKKIIQWLASQSFFTGNNDRNWKADVDYLLRPDKHIQLAEKAESATPQVASFRFGHTKSENK